MNGEIGSGNLITLRIIWAAMLLGQLVYLGVALAIGSPENRNDDLQRLLLYVLIAMAVSSIAVGFILRGILYQRNRQPDGAVAAGAYSTGNILFYAMCEGVGLFGITCTLLNGGFSAHTAVALGAMVVLLLNFPTGRPLRRDDAIRPIHRHE
ncbi:MAG TPA: hypothetical protein VER17_15685 [Tepidisphaeraceae bacterium]|nr:hypothetical protein [Tepidisphaeraceae bacterium]